MTNTTTRNTRHFAGNSSVDLDGFRFELKASGPAGVFPSPVFRLDTNGNGHFVGHADVEVSNWNTTTRRLRRALAALKARNA